MEEVEEDNFIQFEEVVQDDVDVGAPIATPVKKEVKFLESVVSDIRIFEALGNLRPLFLK